MSIFKNVFFRVAKIQIRSGKYLFLTVASFMSVFILSRLSDTLCNANRELINRSVADYLTSVERDADLAKTQNSAVPTPYTLSIGQWLAGGYILADDSIGWRNSLAGGQFVGMAVQITAFRQGNLVFLFGVVFSLLVGFLSHDSFSREFETGRIRDILAVPQKRARLVLTTVAAHTSFSVLSLLFPALLGLFIAIAFCKKPLSPSEWGIVALIFSQSVVLWFLMSLAGCFFSLLLRRGAFSLQAFLAFWLAVILVIPLLHNALSQGLASEVEEQFLAGRRADERDESAEYRQAWEELQRSIEGTDFNQAMQLGPELYKEQYRKWATTLLKFSFKSRERRMQMLSEVKGLRTRFAPIAFFSPYLGMKSVIFTLAGTSLDHSIELENQRQDYVADLFKKLTEDAIRAKVSFWENMGKTRQTVVIPPFSYRPMSCPVWNELAWFMLSSCLFAVFFIMSTVFVVNNMNLSE